MKRIGVIVLMCVCVLASSAQGGWFLVEPSGDSNVRIRTAPSISAPQAQLEFDGDEIPLYVPYGLATKAYKEENGWFNLGKDMWASASVLRRVDIDTPLMPESFSPNVYCRRIGSRGGGVATTYFYRVTELKNGEYVLEMFYRGDDNPLGNVYKGRKENNVLVFTQVINAYHMVYDEAVDFTTKELDFNNIYIREIRYGKKKAVQLSDGTMGLDYNKLSTKEMDQLFMGCDQHSQDDVCITASMLSQARLNNVGKEELVRKLQIPLIWEGISPFNDWITLCDDFDGDGDNELFGVVSYNVDKETGEGHHRIFVVDDNGGTQALENVDGYFCYSPAIAKVALKDRTVTVFGLSTSYGGPGCEPFYWIYDKRKAFRLEGCPGGLVHLSGRDFKCGTSDTNSTYDNDLGMLVGRSWYEYYYYIDDSARLREYGGKPMTEQWLRKKKGSDLAFSKIHKMGGVINSIYYRKNGIFNVNFSVKADDRTDFYYLKGKVGKDDTLHFFQEDEEGIVFTGTYEAAFTPDIATY